MATWFEVDKDGLRRILERRGKSFAILELVQNAYDEAGVTRVDIVLEPVPGRALVNLVVTDDAPEGFSDMAYAYTLFKPSAKVHDPEKRGRFAIGEKLVLAVTEEATISSTKGTVVFDRSGERHAKRTKRETGSEFRATLKLTREELDEALAAVRRVIVPPSIETTLNGEILPGREPVRTIRERLETEIADDTGALRRTYRATDVDIHEPLDGETAMLYELGIPIMETGDRWHVDVRQKVPVTLDRTAVVRPGYLRDIRQAVLSEMSDLLTEDDADEKWIDHAIEDENVSSEAVKEIIKLRFGSKAVIHDPSDLEANRSAIAKGYTVVPGRAFSKSGWKAVKRAQVLEPAGRVLPSPKPFHPDGRPLKLLAEWTPEHERFKETVHALHERLLGFSIRVLLTDDPGWEFNGAYGGGDLYLNVKRLKPDIRDPRTLATVLHEFGHHFGAHLTHAFDAGIASVSAKAILLALDEPGLLNGKGA